MKLIFKNADWSANGIDTTILETIVENVEDTSYIFRYSLSPGNYKAVITPASAVSSFSINERRAVGTDVYALAVPCPANESTEIYFSKYTSSEVDFAPYNQSVHFSISLYKVEDLSYTLMKANVTTVMSITTNASKIYDLHIKLHYTNDQNFRIYNTSSSATELFSDVAENGATYTHRISGVSKIGLRTTIVDAEFEYWLEEVTV